MKLLKTNKHSEMLDIYECPECHKREYYGMFHWHDGHQYCRDCIYYIWEKESMEAARRVEEVGAFKNSTKPDYSRLTYWKRTDKDLSFPKYSDGVNYSEKENEYED